MGVLRAAARSSRVTSEQHKALILVIVCLAQFMVILDATIVNVALPSIQRGLKFSFEDLQWVVNGYTLMFGGFLLLGGRAADLIGRKRLFMAGIVVFAGASMFNALSVDSGMLVIGRAVQGLGGAMISPAALSVLTTTFSEGSERTRALGIWSGIAAGGGAVGLLAGGFLTTVFSWQWNFIVNVPVGIVALLAAFLFVPESTAELEHRNFDILGAVAVTAGLLLLVFSIVKAPTFGWGSPKTIGLFAVSVVLLAGFVWLESRSVSPLVRLSIFTNKTLTVGDTVLLLVASGLFAMFYFASLYAQQVLGYSALRAGIAFLPVALGIGVGAGIAQQLIRRFGVKNTMVLGLALGTIGMAAMCRVPVHGSYPTDLLPALLAIAIGMGFCFVPITLLATSGVSAAEAGLASGLFNTAQQVGGSLGLAILSTLCYNEIGNRLSGLHNPAQHVVNLAKVDGYHVAFAAAAVLMAVGIVLTMTLLRHQDVSHLAVDAAEPMAA